MPQKPKEFSRKDVVRLILLMYRATFPYILAFILALALGTFLITEVFLK